MYTFCRVPGTLVAVKCDVRGLLLCLWPARRAASVAAANCSRCIRLRLFSALIFLVSFFHTHSSGQERAQDRRARHNSIFFSSRSASQKVPLSRTMARSGFAPPTAERGMAITHECNSCTRAPRPCAGITSELKVLPLVGPPEFNQ